MAKKIPMSQEGRARETRRRRKIARATKVGVTLVAAVAITAWSYLILG